MTKLMNKKQEIKNRIDLINKGEVPEGYKKHQGFIHPIDWENISFNKIFQERCVKIGDTTRYPLYSLTIEKGVVPKTEQYERSFLVTKDKDSYKVVKNNDFVYNPMNLRFGAIARYKDQDDCSVSGYYNVFSIINDYNPYFMESFVKSQAMLNYYNTQATGSLIEKQRVHFSQFIEFNFALPSEKEQEKIAEILSCCDKLIELKSELIQKKKKINISTINKVFNNIFYKKNLVKLSNLCSDFIVPMRDKPKTFDGSIPWCRIEDVEGNFLNGTKSNKYVSEDTVKKMNLKIIPSGSVICACSASIGTYVINTTPLITNQTFIGLVCSEKIYNKYLLYFLKTQTNNLMRKSNGTTIGYISREQFERMDIPYVPMQEQMHIANVFFQADKEIELLEQELEQYKQLKKSLSQLLLTGIVRVNEV